MKRLVMLLIVILVMTGCSSDTKSSYYNYTDEIKEENIENILIKKAYLGSEVNILE